MIKNLFGYYLDDGWSFDDTANFDEWSNAIVDFTFIDDVTFKIDHNFGADIEFVFGVEVVYSGVTALNLLPLIPPKFRTSSLLTEYVDVFEEMIGGVLDKTKSLRDLVNPYLIGRDYIGHLASLLGYQFIGEEKLSDDNLRNQLLEAVSFFKVKGTYKALELVGKMTGITPRIYDMYTNTKDILIETIDGEPIVDEDDEVIMVGVDTEPYTEFIPVDGWFVADYEEENPPGLEIQYIKSPHFGFEISLDKCYGTDPDFYLWKADMISVIPELIEAVRPINTVPHIITKMQAITYEDGNVYTVKDTRVNTIVTSNWSFSKRYFDEESWHGESWNGESWHPTKWTFDGSVFFDQNREGFLSSITTCKIGTGHKNVLPTYDDFILENEVLSVGIASKTFDKDKIVFQVRLDRSVVIDKLSELALCMSNGTIVLACTFPNFDKVSGIEHIIDIEVYP